MITVLAWLLGVVLLIVGARYFIRRQRRVLVPVLSDPALQFVEEVEEVGPEDVYPEPQDVGGMAKLLQDGEKVDVVDPLLDTPTPPPEKRPPQPETKTYESLFKPTSLKWRRSDPISFPVILDADEGTKKD